MGTAQKNMIQRISRHIKREKKIRWHIDYITSNPDFKIINCYISELSKEYECKIVRQLETAFKFDAPVKKFGSSDCKTCTSHLLFCSEKEFNFSNRLKRLKLGFIEVNQKVNLSSRFTQIS